MLPRALHPCAYGRTRGATQSPLCAGDITDNPGDAGLFSQSSESMHVARFVYARLVSVLFTGPSLT